MNKFSQLLVSVLPVPILALLVSYSSAQILPPGATVELLSSGHTFTEGPLFFDGGLWFTDLKPNSIWRYDVAAGTTTLMEGAAEGPNGLFLDGDGQMVIAMDGGRNNPGGGRKVVKIDPSTLPTANFNPTTIVDNYLGTPFNSPNDLVISSAGGIYFTDPDYRGNAGAGGAPDAAFYLDPAGDLHRFHAEPFHTNDRPNGIILSPDEKTLYLAMQRGGASMDHHILKYAIEPGTGLPVNGEIFVTPIKGADGMTVDPAGNLYAALSGSPNGNVTAWNPAGDLLFTLETGNNTSNVTFGGENGNTLYITGTGSLWSIDLNIVPEPTSGFLLLTGFSFLRAIIRRRCTAN